METLNGDVCREDGAKPLMLKPLLYWPYDNSAKYLLLLLLALFLISTQAIASVVHDIRIKGLERSEQVTLLRQLPFSTGDSWEDGYSALSERRLRNLGIFSEVTVSAPVDGIVYIRVKERWSLWLLPQATRKDDGSSSAVIVLEEYNLWGLNHHARFAYRRDTGKNFSGMKGTSFESSYHWRRIADSKLAMMISADWGRSLFDAYQQGLQTAQYMQNNRAAGVLFSYALDELPQEGWNINFGYSGSNNQYRFLSGTPQADVIGQRYRALVAGTSYQMVDDHITWLSGLAFNYSATMAHRSWGSTVNSYSHTASLRSYYPVAGENTINMRLNAGVSTGNVQRSGLFDIGSRDGLRGYYPGELQGVNYIYGTVEGRFPVQQGSNLQLVAFADAGKVGGRFGTAVTKGVAVGAGAGMRWTLRWLVNGTIRADAAYGFSTRRMRYYLGTGQTF